MIWQEGSGRWTHLECCVAMIHLDRIMTTLISSCQSFCWLGSHLMNIVTLLLLLFLCLLLTLYTVSIIFRPPLRPHKWWAQKSFFLSGRKLRNISVKRICLFSFSWFNPLRQVSFDGKRKEHEVRKFGFESIPTYWLLLNPSHGFLFFKYGKNDAAVRC